MNCMRTSLIAAAIAAIPKGTVADYDATSLVNSNGTLNLALISVFNDNVDFEPSAPRGNLGFHDKETEFSIKISLFIKQKTHVSLHSSVTLLSKEGSAIARHLKTF